MINFFWPILSWQNLYFSTFSPDVTPFVEVDIAEVNLH